MDSFDESRVRKERWAYWFGPFKTAGKAEVPLQMADLLAHETWSRAKEAQSPNPRAIRKSFERVLVNGHIEMRPHGREHCIENAKCSAISVPAIPTG